VAANNWLLAATFFMAANSWLLAATFVMAANNWLLVATNVAANNLAGAAGNSGKQLANNKTISGHFFFFR
jgi:hypothetical protein